MATKRDYYEVLGVQKSAGADELKRAYRKLAGANHPDRNPGDKAAEDRFKEAAEAFEVLSDPEKRARYDRFGHQAFQGGGGPQFQDLGDVFEQFGDLFGDLFGGGGGGGARRRGHGRRVQQGDHLRMSLDLELKDAVLGCKRTVTLERAEYCETCDGSGARPGSKSESCDYCQGRGQVVQSQGFFRVQTTCPSCRGSGKIIRDKCGQCSGSGRQHKRVDLEVKVPAGVDSGMQLCIRGEGEPGPDGGPRGDLYLDLRITKHPFFDREGTHLICRVPITYAQAALGADFEIPLIEGKHKLEIPAGTQPGDVLRVRGQGLPEPQGARRGDLLVQVQVEVPKRMNKKQEELIRELAALDQQHQVKTHHKSFIEKIWDFFGTTEPAEEQTPGK
jgi:molecular chaperone DnaJ